MDEGDKRKRVKFSQTLLNLLKEDANLLTHTIAADETMVSFVNPDTKHAWTPKGEPGPSAVKPQFPDQRMVCFFFDSLGFIHVEILQKRQSVDAPLYCAQLGRVNTRLLKCRTCWPATYFLQDNASAHRAAVTSVKIAQLEWTKLPHPPYSPDLNPTDYGVNRALKDDLRGRQFKDESDLAKFLEVWAKSKPPSFFRRQFDQLPKRWEAVIQAGGDYFDEAALKKEIENQYHVRV